MNPLRRLIRATSNRVLQILIAALCVAALISPFAVANLTRRPHGYPGMGTEAYSSLFARGNDAAASAILDNVWTLDRYAPVRLPDSLSWTEDPYHDLYWRFEFYGLRPLQDLLYAWYDTAETAYRDKLYATLESFLDVGVKSPYLTTDVDLHAAAWRAMVLVNIHQKLARSGDLPAALGSALLARIEVEGNFLADPAHFEGTYNHGVNQSAALLVIATTFPSMSEAPRWRSLAMQRLEVLTTSVVDPDGVEVENSPYYHYYVLDTLQEIVDWASRAGVELPADIPASVRAMTRFAADIVMPNGHIPLIGASIDLDVPHAAPDTVRELAAESPSLAYVLSEGLQGTPPDRASLFTTSGIAVLRSPLAKGESLPDQTWLSFLAGPWRSPHSQLGGLGVTLYSDGQVLLPDAGLYHYAPVGTNDTYYASDYFYGTQSHNTVIVNGENQAEDGKVAAGQTIASADGWSYQSGWSQATGRIVHRRGVVLLSHDVVLVVDQLEGSDSDTYQQVWHMAPDLAMSQQGLTTYGSDSSGKRVLAIRQAVGDGVQVGSTADGAMASWYSSTYGSKVANPAVEYTSQGHERWYVTLITTGASAADAGVMATTSPDGVAATVCVGGQMRLVQIGQLAQTGEQVGVSSTGGSCADAPAPAAVAVTAPAPYSAVTGTVRLAANASGARPISRVDFSVNGKVVGSATSAPFAVNWHSDELADGSAASITATALDSSGYATTSLPRDVVVSRPSGSGGSTVVSLTFDDSTADQYTVEPILAQYGMHATFYVITGSIGVAGALNLTQLRQLAADGSEIGSHTVDHIPLDTLPNDEQLRQLCDSRNRLLDLGFAVTTLAYPFSAFDAGTARLVEKCGYNGARIPGLKPDGRAAGPLVPDDPYLIPAVPSFDATTTLADMVAAVTRAEGAGGGWVPLVFHRICLDTCSSIAVSPDTFKLLAAWLSARSGSGTTVQTVAQVLGGAVKPEVVAPAASSFGDASNLLSNPGLERANPLLPGGAECWTGKASKVAPYDKRPIAGQMTLVADSHSGDLAAKLTITSFLGAPTGNLSLRSQQDEGQCAPRAIAGHRYSLSAWYRSEVPVTLAITYRDSTGRWRLLGSSQAFAAASTWTEATWISDALPADATNVAVRVSISAIGTASVDDLTLRDAGVP